jgi:hypothetical protein
MCWGFARRAVVATTTVSGVDRGYTIDATTGTYDVALTAAATLGDGFVFGVYNSGSGTVTINPNASETIRSPAGSGTTLALSQGQGVLVLCDGAAFEVIASTGLAPTAGSVISGLTANRVVTALDATTVQTPASVTTAQAWSFTSTLAVVDGNFTITGSSDATKTIKFEVDGQAAGADLVVSAGAQTADRTLSMPVLISNDTLSALNVAQTFTQANTFSATQTSFGTTGQTVGATEMRINGGETNANDGARVSIWNGVGSRIQFGNKSAILGGAYDGKPYFYSNGTVEFSDNIEMTNAKNFVLATSTGTKLGTGTTQKLGFWNATPVAQQTVTGSKATGAALADLLTKLATIGIIVDGTSA